jgi:hypothetical protein
MYSIVVLLTGSETEKRNKYITASNKHNSEVRTTASSGAA